MLDKQILIELKEYVHAHLDIRIMEKHFHKDDYVIESQYDSELIDFIENNRKPALTETLFQFIDKSGATDAEIYKKARIDRRHFSKIRSNPNYKPKKNTMMALALALELNKEEADELLNSAGYSLTANETVDLVIQFCLNKRIYDLQHVNEALVSLDVQPLI